MTRFGFLYTLLILMFTLVSCAPQPTKEVPAEFKKGQELFHSVCSDCHGPDAMGGHTKAPRLIDTDFIQSAFSDDEIRDTINNGSTSGKMPSQKGKLTDAEITELIKYLRHSQKAADLIVEEDDIEEDLEAEEEEESEDS